jgi:lysophospholipase L1-like esterase
LKNQLTILIYGDSRPWGQIPSIENKVDRYDKSIRWPAVLKNLIAGYADIIEECLPGRTLCEKNEGNKEYKNGLTPFKSIYPSHVPLTHIIIDLGTNDLKIEFKQSAKDLHRNLKKYIAFVESFSWRMATKPEIIYMLPDPPDSRVLCFGDTTDILAELKQLCLQDSNDYSILECNSITQSLISKQGKDGVHLDKYHHLQYSWFMKEYFDKIIKSQHIE